MTTKYDCDPWLNAGLEGENTIRGIFRTTGKMLVLSYNCVKFPESDNAVVVLECVRALSRVWLFTTTWNSGQGHWSGLPFPAPRYPPDPGIEPKSPTLQTDSTHWATREASALLFYGYGITIPDHLPPPLYKFLFLLFVFGHTVLHVVSWFPNKGLNLSPLHWECRVLTTGPPGRFLPKPLNPSFSSSWQLVFSFYSLCSHLYEPHI